MWDMMEQIILSTNKKSKVWTKENVYIVKTNDKHFGRFNLPNLKSDTFCCAVFIAKCHKSTFIVWFCRKRFFLEADICAKMSQKACLVSVFQRDSAI